MTIPATSRVSPIYNGNASATNFAFAFKTYAKAELQVIVSDGITPTTLTLDSDYSVTLNADQVATPGGSILYPITGSPLPFGKTLVVVSAVPNSQQISLPTGGAFNATVVELGLDRQQVQLQQMSDIASRTVRAPAGETFTGTLPAALARANSLSAFDNTGQPTAIPYGLGNFTGTVSSTALREKQTATAGQTTFTLTTIAVAVGAVQVFVDGFELPASDITVNSATSVTIGSPLKVNQQVEFVTNTFSTFGSGKATINHVSTSSTDVGSLIVQRTASAPGGTFGWVNAAIRADSYVSAGVTSFEWTVVGVCHNYATGGENVGGYFQGIKYSTGPTWGATIEVIDNTGANPTSGAVGLEVDVNGNGTDANNARIGIDIAIRRPPAAPGASMEVAYGLRFQNSFDASTKYNTLIGCYPGINVGIGIDLSAAVIIGAAVNLNTNQSVNFGGNAGVAALVRNVFHNGSGYLFANAAGTTYWALNDTGSLVVKGVQILGARQTVTGSRATDAWRTSLMAALAAHGLATDSTTA